MDALRGVLVGQHRADGQVVEADHRRRGRGAGGSGDAHPQGDDDRKGRRAPDHGPRTPGRRDGAQVAAPESTPTTSRMLSTPTSVAALAHQQVADAVGDHQVAGATRRGRLDGIGSGVM